MTACTGQINMAMHCGTQEVNGGLVTEPTCSLLFRAFTVNQSKAPFALIHREFNGNMQPSTEHSVTLMTTSLFRKCKQVGVIFETYEA